MNQTRAHNADAERRSRLIRHAQEYADDIQSLIETDFATNGHWLRSVAADSVETMAKHGNWESWEQCLVDLPRLGETWLEQGPVVEVGSRQPLTEDDLKGLNKAMRGLIPWRKGPFRVFDILIDAEWRSDQKWSRVASKLPDIDGHRIADIGCGNGYYLWRMLGAGARCVVGFDPGILPIMQFRAVKAYAAQAPAIILPFGDEKLAAGDATFDTVFSMGVLYHRRDPTRHLRLLRQVLRTGGNLILETLVSASNHPIDLSGDHRYAGMRNVWSVPAADSVCDDLRATGFDQVSCVDQCATTTAEQRSTEWMPYHSLATHLDASDPGKTVEGHAAPVRAIFLATATV